MKDMEAVILAGGLGERMGELTAAKQKCLMEVDGVPALGHVIDNLVTAFGSVDLKLGVSYRADDVVDFVNHYKPDNVSVTYVPHARGSESYGAFRTMEPYIKGPFIAGAGDVIAGSRAYKQTAEHFNQSDFPIVATLSPKLDEVTSHGAGSVVNGEINEYHLPNSDRIQPHHLRDMMIYATDPTFFSLLDRYPSSGGKMSEFMVKAINDELAVGGTVYEAHWIHLADAKDLQKSMKRSDNLPIYLYPPLTAAS